MLTARSTPRHATFTEPLDVAAVLRHHGRDILRWAARLGGPLVDPEEVMQEVLVVVERRISGFRPDAKIASWLYKITQNIATTRRRRERLRRWLRGLPRDYARDLPAVGLLPIEQMEREEAAAEVYAALDGIDEKYRTVVILFELEGLSGQEIAALTGMPLGTVWIRLRRGRERFRQRYRALRAKDEQT